MLKRKKSNGGILQLKKLSGRGPPTAPALRSRVLTPRDQYVHRGGERWADYAPDRKKLQPVARYSQFGVGDQLSVADLLCAGAIA